MSTSIVDLMDVLRTTEVVGVQQAGGLQVFGLRWAWSDDTDYATLDEALRDQSIEVMEINEAGRVPTLKVVNKSHRMVFLMAGEQLVGCKQNRVLDASMMAPADAEISVPVSCVERGRWGYQSQKFRSGNSSSHSSLRMMMYKQAHAHYKAHGTAGSDQAAVWAEVNRKMGKMSSSSTTGALQDMFRDYDPQMNKVLSELAAPENCNGAAFAIRGKIVGADLFDKPATLNKLWPKLVKSFAIDAFENERIDWNPLPSQYVSEWLKSATSASQEWFDSPGVGHDVRIEGKQLVGAMLVVDQSPIHLELFREDEAPRSARPTQDTSEGGNVTGVINEFVTNTGARQRQSAKDLRATQDQRYKRLVEKLMELGLTCPHCSEHSRDIRAVDRDCFFICQVCGRSFRPDDA